MEGLKSTEFGEETVSRMNQISDVDNWMMSIYSHKNRTTEEGNKTGWEGGVLKITNGDHEVWNHCHTENSSKVSRHSRERSKLDTEICESEAKSHIKMVKLPEERVQRSKV